MVVISVALAHQAWFTWTFSKFPGPSGLLLQASFGLPIRPCEFLCLLLVQPFSPHLFLPSVSLPLIDCVFLWQPHTLPQVQNLRIDGGGARGCFPKFLVSSLLAFSQP